MSNMTTATPEPDVMLAHVRVLRLTDKHLGVADELRKARDEFQSLVTRPVACHASTSSRNAAKNHRRKSPETQETEE